MKVIFSKSALKQARERGVTIKQIKKAIERGAKHLQGKKIVSDYTYIRIVYKKIKNKNFIITVMVKQSG